MSTLLFANLRLPFGQFTHPLPRYPYIYEKVFKNFSHEKKLGGGGGKRVDPERKGVATKLNKFSYFSFSYFFLLS